MASTAVIMKRLVFITRGQKNILMEEANRRLRNCSPSLHLKVKKEHLTILNNQMVEAGHSQRFRDMITSRFVARYCNSPQNHLRQERGVEGEADGCTELNWRGRGSGKRKEDELQKPTRSERGASPPS